MSDSDEGFEKMGEAVNPEERSLESTSESRGSLFGRLLVTYILAAVVWLAGIRWGLEVGPGKPFWPIPPNEWYFYAGLILLLVPVAWYLSGKLSQRRVYRTRKGL